MPHKTLDTCKPSRSKPALPDATLQDGNYSGAQVITQVLRDNAQMSVMASKLDQMASSQIRQDPKLAMQAVALMENLGALAAPLRKTQRNFY